MHNLVRKLKAISQTDRDARQNRRSEIIGIDTLSDMLTQSDMNKVEAREAISLILSVLKALRDKITVTHTAMGERTRQGIRIESLHARQDGITHTWKVTPAATKCNGIIFCILSDDRSLFKKLKPSLMLTLGAKRAVGFVCVLVLLCVQCKLHI